MSEDNDKFWKSPAEKRGEPDFLKARENEFAGELPLLNALEGEGQDVLGFSRRDFLKLMGFSLAAATAACSRMPVKKAIPYLTQPEGIVPGKALWYASTCAGCSAACGILVKNRDGRPIKVEGNPESSLNRGGLCAVGQAQVLSLYDSGRLHGPMLKGRAVSWEEVDGAVAQGLKSAQGKIRVLSPTIVSPSTREVIASFLTAYSDGKHVEYDAISYAGILDAHEQIFSTRVLPRFRFDKADLIVSVAADFLGSWISPVEFSKGYAGRRRIAGRDGAQMARHVQFESVMSLAGANADSRVTIKPSEEGSVILRLYDAVMEMTGGPRLAGAPSLFSAGADDAIRNAARDLVRHGGRSLVVCGSNDVAIQSAVAAVNVALGNYGSTIDAVNPSFQKNGSDRDMAELIGEMERGEVAALVIYDANPAYDWHEAGRFAAALKKVPFSVSLNRYMDETASLAEACCPDHHFLESWNDARPAEGIDHLAQPVIRPLYDTRAAQDSFIKWAGLGTDYLGFLKDRWNERVFPSQNRFLVFSSFWNQCVHDGVFVSSADAGKKIEFKGNMEWIAAAIVADAEKTRKSEGVELKLYESSALRDGAHANNPWLQEVPDPVSKVTWGNFVAVAPAFAAARGLTDGDVVSVRADGAKMELPVHVQPGQALDTVGIALGYGRTAAGKVGNGVGGNAFSFHSAGHGTRGDSRAVTIEKTGRRDELACTQEHDSMEGRDIVQDMSFAAFAVGKSAKDHAKPGAEMLWQQHDKVGYAWGMAIDLNACIGCSGCLIGCQAENNVPVVGKDEVQRRREMHWIRIDRYYKGDEANPDTVFQPMMCQHCANAPCESVCPVAATMHSADGLNQQAYNRCVGTRYCANNCPYKVRRFNWFDYADNSKFDYGMNDEVGKLVLNPDVVVRSRGVMEKCSMCIQRIQEGKLKAKMEGRELADGDVKAACQQSCPADAIVFGDLMDPESAVSKVLKDNPRKYHVLGELNVQPAVAYLNKVRNR
jgi:molybdopterin-containing oxidoreductase family iron-sulfur binding subunit